MAQILHIIKIGFKFIRVFNSEVIKVSCKGFLFTIILSIHLTIKSLPALAISHYEARAQDQITQTAISYLKEYIREHCESKILDFGASWEEKARFHLKLNDQSKVTMMRLIDELSIHIKHDRICRHITKITVFSQASQISITRNIELLSKKALDGISYLSREQINSRLRRTLRGFTESDNATLIKKRQNLQDLDIKLGSEKLRENLLRGLGALSLIEPQEVEELRVFLVGEGLVSEFDFEQRLQQGLSAIGRKGLVGLVKPVVRALRSIGISDNDIGRLYLENPHPFLNSKEIEIRLFYDTYFEMLKNADNSEGVDRQESEWKQKTLNFIKEKMYLTPGLRSITLRGFISMVRMRELNLSHKEALDVFHKVVLDISHNKLDWERIVRNIRILSLLKDEDGSHFFSSTQLVHIIKNHIRSLSSNQLTNILTATRVDHRTKYGNFLANMAGYVVADPEELNAFKTLLDNYLRLTKKELKKFLVEHYKVFIENDENQVISQIEPIMIILKKYMTSERLKEVLLASFHQLMKIESSEDFELILDELESSFADKGNTKKREFVEVLEVLISGGELINLDLDMLEMRKDQAQEMTNWGYTIKEALIHTFESRNLKGPFAEITARQIKQRREILEASDYISPEFLRHNEDLILSTPIDIFRSGVEQAKEERVSRAALQRWIQMGYFKHPDINVNVFRNIDETFIRLILKGRIKYSQLYSIIISGHRDKHSWIFPHGITKSIESVLSKINDDDLSWLLPKLYVLFSHRGLEVLERIENQIELKRLSSTNLAKYIYLGLTEIHLNLNNTFLLRAMALSAPRSIWTDCSEAL